ncbi:MAG: phosphoheptose isomerase [Acidobacteria bacterium]|nr:MAG: phosphoheptose isomerase [Acidobacteriota bacterium]
MNRVRLATITPQPLPVPTEVTSTRQYFKQYNHVIANLPYATIEQVAAELLRVYEEGRAIFLFGNGGSAALASHVACDLGKGTLVEGNSCKRFRVLPLTDNVPLMTAWANDSSYERIFAEQLRNFVAPDDVAFAISGSGNSLNVLQALEVAKGAGAFTIGLAGFQGGRMKALCDLCIVVPSDNMQIIEDFHVGVAHALFTLVRKAIHAKDTSAVCADD